MGLKTRFACAALGLALSGSSQGDSAGMRLLGKYDGGGRGVEIGADAVRVSIPLDARACHGAGRRLTLYLRGLRADEGPHPGYRVLLVRRGARSPGEPVGEFNFYGSGPGTRRDVSFELAPGLLANRQGPCAVRLLLQAAGPAEKAGRAAIDSLEVWRQ
ncbi:hypothetical protein ACFFU8_20095 [Chromobacterium piscinae]|uniref:hypothetical protein n=1 Tax=Chromobacterium piscinae TaxID=686831 RepID=UPI001408AF54|nr:hypothetical protein [Chromobacterium piscinae]MBX9298535.1 hypothetical protein [Chromobacterium vaccinii]MBX9357962.1 hypothetical protein [Chromobacterium vaccinii]MCD5327824.1 hypothetical protein [Chromobacterium piscinae]NHQ80776.1 hypothetical protein [Chromobacterium vaccinii]